MAPHSSTLAWKTPWKEEPGRLQSMGLLGVRHNWATSLSLFTFMHWRRNGNPLQCSCLENPRVGEPDGLPSMGSHRVRHDWSDLAAAAAAVRGYKYHENNKIQLNVNCCLVAKSCLSLLQPHRLKSTRLLCPWDFPGKNTGVGCHLLLQGIFSTQESNLCLLNLRQILYH